MQCLGTRLVILAAPKDGGGILGPKQAPEGLLVVYEKNRPSSSSATTAAATTTTTASSICEWPVLIIEIGTNYASYKGELDVSQIRSQDDEKKNMSEYLLQDGREHPDIQIRFEYQSDETTISIVIQQRLGSTGLQKCIYSGSLKLIMSSSSSSSQGKPSLLQFCHNLGKAFNESRQQIEVMKRENANAMQARDHWKDTAEKLSRDVWQKEKDTLVHNFLKLWNEKQAKQKKQFADLKAELEATKATLVTKSNEKRGRNLKLDEDFANAAEDDIGAGSQPVPPDQLEALASGRRLPRPQRPTVLNQENTISAATLKQQEADYQQRTRKRPRKETTPPANDSDTDVDDSVAATKKAPAESPPAPKVESKQPKAQETMASAEDSDSDVDESAAVKKKAMSKPRPAPKIEAKKRKAKQKTTSAKDSDTDVDEAAAGKKKATLKPRRNPKLESKQTKAQQLPASVNALSKSLLQETDSPAVMEDSDDERQKAAIRAQMSKMLDLSSSDED